MKKGLTEIIFVLDESGSMGMIKNDAIGGFNEFLSNQRKIKGEAVFTFVKFDTRYNVVEEGALLENVNELSDDNYQPGGMTALLDAVGKTINKVSNRHATLDESEKPEKVLMVVFTDGEENASNEFRETKKVAKLVEQKEDEGWEILFLRADIDA